MWLRPQKKEPKPCSGGFHLEKHLDLVCLLSDHISVLLEPVLTPWAKVVKPGQKQVPVTRGHQKPCGTGKVLRARKADFEMRRENHRRELTGCTFLGFLELRLH